MALPREKTHQVMVGSVPVGGGAPVAVQSMTNAPMLRTNDGPLLDAEATLAQIDALSAKGCEIIRTAIPNLKSLDAFEHICAASSMPVIADVHFDHRIAIGAIQRGAAAVRINPGNIGDMAKVDAVIDAAGQADIPIRIGVNAGSLDPVWRERHELSAGERLVGSAISFIQHFEDQGFHHIVVSAKAHSVMTCVEAYQALSQEVPHVPLHLGVTEAGTLLPGTVKSSVGMGILLAQGIGDTFRVSLTEDVCKEVEVAWDILAALGLRRRFPELVSCPTCSRCEVNMIDIAKEVEARLRTVQAPLQVAVMGCVVNGPGEARDADVGVACGRDCGVLFVRGQQVRKVDSALIVDALFEQIDHMVQEAF